MLQGLGGCDALQLVERERAEGAAAGRQDEFFYWAYFAHEALEDGAVLAIDGQQRHLVLQAEAGDEFAGHDERLLVGQGDGLARLDGADGGAQTAEAHKGRQHDVHRPHLHHLAEGIGSRIDLYRFVLQGLADVVVLALVGNHHARGLIRLGLPDEQVGIPSSRQHVCLEEVAVLGDDLKRLRADASRGAYYANLLFQFFFLMS